MIPHMIWQQHFPSFFAASLPVCLLSTFAAFLSISKCFLRLAELYSLAISPFFVCPSMVFFS